MSGIGMGIPVQGQVQRSRVRSTTPYARRLSGCKWKRLGLRIKAIHTYISRLQTYYVAHSETAILYAMASEFRAPWLQLVMMFVFLWLEFLPRKACKVRCRILGLALHVMHRYLCFGQTFSFLELDPEVAVFPWWSSSHSSICRPVAFLQRTNQICSVRLRNSLSPKLIGLKGLVFKSYVKNSQLRETCWLPEW